MGKKLQKHMRLETKKIYLLLGTNLGERLQYLQDALILIAEKVGVVGRKSSIYETAAWGKTDQPGFLNLAVEVETLLTPIELLHVVLEIEKLLGRIRHEKWGARVIDIDIILYDDQIVDLKDQLQIPHPEMQYRRFVMQPLSEIAEDVLHPILKKSMKAILSDLTDSLDVVKL